MILPQKITSFRRPDIQDLTPNHSLQPCPSTTSRQHFCSPFGRPIKLLNRNSNQGIAILQFLMIKAACPGSNSRTRSFQLTIFRCFIRVSTLQTSSWPVRLKMEWTALPLHLAWGTSSGLAKIWPSFSATTACVLRQETPIIE